uniref:Reverse transcriptase domain-containing protein n=1 Tax=Tanacetum cinerariifolium TaxID=118510 RepID=A0A699HK70_TANCI|nr:reverse transcriptase domain-containing protein [Tanacetum cinerariifolium]
MRNKGCASWDLGQMHMGRSGQGVAGIGSKRTWGGRGVIWKGSGGLQLYGSSSGRRVNSTHLLAGNLVGVLFGMHADPRSVVAKSLGLGYYWPTIHAEARKLIRECKSCQVYRPVLRNLQQNLTPITSPWPFYKWRIDIAGPFPEGPGKVKFLIVAIDYFTKWIEAKHVANITGAQHPQANGLVEKANRSLGEGIKAWLDERIKSWLEEISHVLWAHHTMVKSINGETPFSLTYGTKAVNPVEIDMPTLRTAYVDMIKNNEALEINLDLLEERRE